MKSLSEEEVKALMRTDAYTNKFNPERNKIQQIVQQGFENLYPDDDRNIHPENYYVWYTRDDDKVRESHAQRQGQVFSWDNPPEGGHPGEDYGCRCLAVKYIPPYNKNREIAEREQQIQKLQSQIDLKNGNNTVFEERILSIESELTQIKEKIYQTSKQGFFDGMEGADEGSGNAAKIADYFRKNPITELENLLVGGISGAAGTAYAEYKYLEQEKLRLEKEKDFLNNKIDNNNKEVTKLEAEISKLEQQIENIKSS